MAMRPVKRDRFCDIDRSHPVTVREEKRGIAGIQILFDRREPAGGQGLLTRVRERDGPILLPMTRVEFRRRACAERPRRAEVSGMRCATGCITVSAQRGGFALLEDHTPDQPARTADNLSPCPD